MYRSKYIVYDKEKSEIVEGARVTTPKQIEALMKKEEYEQFKNKKGYFIMYIFGNNRDISDLKPQTAARLMYLSTWLQYDGDYLVNRDGKMTREQIKAVMGLKSRTFDEFLSEITKTGYVIKDDNSYRLNKDYFQKGRCELNKSLAEHRYVRVYIDYIRTLYKKTPQSKHVHLGYIFQLIPYINCEYNVLCHNPLEKDPEKIIPMTVGEFCEAIGYDVSQASRLLNIYDGITFEVNGKNCYFCGYTGRRNQKDQDRRIYINPFIFFAGSDKHQVDVLKILFV